MIIVLDKENQQLELYFISQWKSSCTYRHILWRLYRHSCKWPNSNQGCTYRTLSKSSPRIWFYTVKNQTPYPLPLLFFTLYILWDLSTCFVSICIAPLSNTNSTSVKHSW